MSPPRSTACRGFAHPLVLLVRSSIHATALEQQCTQTALSQSNCVVHQYGVRFASSKSRAGHNTSRKPSQTTPAVQTSISRSPATTGERAHPSTAASSLEFSAAAHAGYAQMLARKPAPTTLYEAARQRAFLFSSYAAGVTLFGGATINSIVNVFNLPEGVPEWVAFPFGFVSVMMAVVGARFAMTPAGVVQTIRVLPAVSSASAGPSKTTPKPLPSATSATSPVSPSRAQLEVMVRRTTPVPGLPLQRILCEPHEIIMKARMYNRPPPTLTPMEQAFADRKTAAQKQAEIEYEKTHIMTAPFRHGWWALKTFFVSIRQGLTGEGFAPIEVKGVKYKLDITDGYALDEGRALDRIVQIDEDRSVAALRNMRR